MEQIEKEQVGVIRKVCSRLGWAVLLYNFIMTVSVRGAARVDHLLAGSGNGDWGYLVAIFLSIILMLIWKKPRFFSESVFKQGRAVRTDDFMLILLLFIGVQGVQSVLSLITEFSLNSIGYTMMGGVRLISGQSDELVMFLYTCVGAPIAEELLFRGLVIRPLECYGRRFAIVASALLFGLFHGNLIQAPYAVLVGLILGYVAIEYSIGWAMVLHMFNNMIFADTLTRLLPGIGGQLLSIGLMWGGMIAGIVILIVRRKDIKAYCRFYINHPFCWRSFWSAAGIIVFIIAMFGLVIRTMSVLITPLG